MEVLYNKSHLWMLIENNIAAIGISKFGAISTGSGALIELPLIGDTIHKDELLCKIRSYGMLTEIVSPISGEVVDVNFKLESFPEIFSQDPEGDGWLVKLQISDLIKAKALREREDLMNKYEYNDYVKNIY